MTHARVARKRGVRRAKRAEDLDPDLSPVTGEPRTLASAPATGSSAGHDFRRLGVSCDRDSDRYQDSDRAAPRDTGERVDPTVPQPVRLLPGADGALRLVSRQGVPAAATATADPAADEFLKQAAMGPQLVAVNGGAFDATYTPATGQIDIIVRGNVNFTDGLTLTGGTLVAATTDLTQAATDGNSLPTPEARAAFLTQFQWDGTANAAFLSTFESRIESAWGGKFTFKCTRPGWDKVKAQVGVDVQVRAGAAAANDHLGITSYKVPDSGQYQVGNFVGGTGASAGFNPMTVDSTSAAPNPERMALLQRKILFANNSAQLTPAALASLAAFTADFKTNNVPMSNTVSLEGHSSTVGKSEYNRTLAQSRVIAVREELVRLGFDGVADRVNETSFGEEGANPTDPAQARRVDLRVGSGESQVRAAHEFGHAIGLGDEYAINPGGSIQGTGQATGTVTSHDGLAKQIGAPGSVNENNDNIMSLGNTVRPQHYATFGAALRQLTNVSEWSV